jgi:hypothetical protein
LPTRRYTAAAVQNLRCLFAGLFAIGIAVNPAFAERFSYKYRQGQVLSTRAKLAGASMIGQRGGAMARMRFRVTVRQTVRVASVGSGIITLEVTETPVAGQMTAMGRTEPYPRTVTRSLIRMTERGKFLDRKELGPRQPAEGEDKDDRGMEAADAFFGLSFPDRELNPGDVWEETVQVGDAAQPRAVHLRSRYVGREMFRGRSCIKITSVASMTASETTGAPPPGAVSESEGGVAMRGKMTAALTTYFDPVAGVEVYQRATLTLVTRTDLSGLSPDAGEFVSVSRINSVQGQEATGRRK